ncbi:MAG: hypothetical protein V8T01_07135 [Oscillospiraceae bacterium]
MNVCEFCGREIPRGRLCTKHLAMRVLLPVRYWQKVAKNANKAAIGERRMDLESEQRWRAEASKALAAERAEAEEAKENMESALRALEQTRAELKEEHIRRLEEQMEVRHLESALAGRLLAEWKERKVPRTPLGQEAETCKRWMCEPKSCQAWLSCRGRLEPREQIRELTEAMGYAGGTV